MNFFSKLAFLKPIFNKLFRMLNKRQKLLMLLVMIMTIGFSLVETIGISAIMPFISVVSDTGKLESGYYKKAYDLLKFTSPEKFIIVFGICIIVFYIFRGIYSILLAYVTKKYSNSIYKYYSKKAFKINLTIPYKKFAQKNSAEIMHSIYMETREIGNVIFNLLHISSEIFTIILVYILIVMINWKMTLIITAILFFIVIIFMAYITKMNSIQGRIKFTTSRKMNRILKETLGNLKFVKLKGNENEIVKTYNGAVEDFAKAELINEVLAGMPKSVLESLGFSFLIGVVVVIVWIFNSASMVIPVISMYALALYRVLPSISRMLYELNKMIYSEETINKVDENMSQTVDIEGSETVSFNKSIRLDNVCFQYMTGPEVISNISLVINKGEKIAFTGESGSGKST
ncbi:MAG: ABC transporter transmembrane domain-containing protein, partial [Treponema sp.]|nr:ABC transporter transmembrane domain-containing protein [Treponema sp.]